MAGRSPNIYIRVGDVELWVYIAENGLVGLDNPFEVDINEEIVRVDVLFDETFYLQKCRKQIPFILDIVRPVEAAPSIAYFMGDTPFENVDLFSHNRGCFSYVGFERGVHIGQVFLPLAFLHFFYFFLFLPA